MKETKTTNILYLDENIRDMKETDKICIEYESNGVPFRLMLYNIGGFLKVYNRMSNTTHTGSGFGVLFQEEIVQLMISWNGSITSTIDIPKTAKVTIEKQVKK